jgi:hypothetical protein
VIVGYGWKKYFIERILHVNSASILPSFTVSGFVTKVLLFFIENSYEVTGKKNHE